MPVNTAFNQRRSFLTSFNQFVSAYQEITVSELQKQREVIVKNRGFTDGLLDVFVDLKQSLKSEQTDKSHFTFTTTAKNDSEISLFLSFETKFSTNISRKVFEDYKKYISTHTTDRAVAGEVGKRLYTDTMPSTDNVVFFPLSETVTFNTDIATLTDYVLKYKRVTVFNPYFISLVEQVTRITNITGDIPLYEETLQAERQNRKFLYEPEGDTILQFFEVQVCASLLVQAVQEARLATIGGRITSLEKTYTQVENALYTLNTQERKFKKGKANKKQQQRLAGLLLWK